MSDFASQKNDDGSVVFGFNLISNKSYVHGQNPGTVYELHRRKLSRFINMLYDPDRAITYCIRTIVRTFHKNPTGGEVVTYLLVKLPETARSEIDQLALSVKLLLAGNLDNSYWQEITDPDELRAALDPIDLPNAFHAEIHRRYTSISEENLLPERGLGFIENPPTPRAVEERDGSVFFVHPFTPPDGGFEKLLPAMLNSHQDMVFTSILSPTILNQQERDLLYQQISFCETKRGLGGNELAIPNVLAGRLADALMKQLLSLQDAPYMMHFYVSSPKKIDKLVLEFCGQAVTEPIGFGSYPGSHAQSWLYNVGGYDVATAGNSDEKESLASRVKTLSHDPWKQKELCETFYRFLHMFEANEALCGFYFPVNAEANLPGIEIHSLIEQPLPRELVQLGYSDTEKLLIGKNYASGFEQDVFIPEETRRQHAYIVGQTGTGKSTLMKTMIISDMKAGRGMTVIDPHGELYNDLLEMVPEHRKNDVVLLDPGDFLFPIGLNILEVTDENQREAIVKEMKAIFKRIIREYHDLPTGEYAGPLFFQHVQNNMLLTMSDLENPGTILEFNNIFQLDNFWKRWLPLKSKTPALEIWVKVLDQVDYGRATDGRRYGDYFSSRFEDLINDPRLANIFGQPRTTIDIAKVIEENKILLVNLSKGLLGEANSALFGMIVLAKINAALMERVNLIRQGRQLTPHYLYVDEFQNIATENFSILLAEARKFGLGLVLANQYLNQINDHKIKNAIFGNVGTIISFRLGFEDARQLEGEFIPSFNAQELCNLPNYYAALRTNIGGERTSPCSFKTIRLEKDANTAKKEELLDISRASYAMPKNLADFLIATSLDQERTVELDVKVERSGEKKEIFASLELNELCPESMDKEVFHSYFKGSTLMLRRRVVKYLLSSNIVSKKKTSEIFDLMEESQLIELIQNPWCPENLEAWGLPAEALEKISNFVIQAKTDFLDHWLKLAANEFDDEDVHRRAFEVLNKISDQTASDYQEYIGSRRSKRLIDDIFKLDKDDKIDF